jgi:hypothetical protein
LRQGFDQVYRAKDGSIVVIEAKGCTSALSRAYGCEQGTPEWAVQAAKRVAESFKASAAEKQAARFVLDAAKKGNLTVLVVRTRHVLGEPVAAVLESTLKSGPTESKRATEILNEAPAILPKPRVVKAEGFSRELGALAGVEEKQVGTALAEASEHIRVPGQSRWIKVGGKMFKFVGRVAGPAGIVIAASVYSAEAAKIEMKLERGDLTREQANTEQAKLAARTSVSAGGALVGMEAGAVIGTFICPGPGTVIGGVVGAVSGFIGAEIMMAATGLTDTLAEYLRPGVECVRQACQFVKEKSIAITVAAREQMREWVGPETFDQIADALGSAATWVGETASQAGTAVKDAAVFAKEKTVDAAVVVGDTVSDGATWTWRKMKSGWTYLRSRFE